MSILFTRTNVIMVSKSREDEMDRAHITQRLRERGEKLTKYQSQILNTNIKTGSK
jgi:hypothetical protein